MWAKRMEEFPFPMKINMPESPPAKGDSSNISSASSAVPVKYLDLNETEQVNEIKTLKGSSILYTTSASTNSGFISPENRGVL